MERILGMIRRWGSTVAAVVFFVLWCVAEAGRMGGQDWSAFLSWRGNWMLVASTLAIALSRPLPYASLGVTGALLAGQLSHAVPPPYDNDWAIYLGSSIALAFILWTAPPRTAYVAAGLNVIFCGAVTVLLLSWRYGAGVGWVPMLGGEHTLRSQGYSFFALFLLIAAVSAAAGLLFRALERETGLRRARQEAESSLQLAEVDLLVEQERGRIARELHDVLAHSLAVIAAQADGARYLGNGQPRPVEDALETIAASARTALVDAQRVIEGMHDDGVVAPQPTLEDVDPLLALMRGSLKVHRTDTGSPVELGEGQQLAVYRIIQECLTNALRHGGQGTSVHVHLDWSGPGLTLHVASAMAPARPAAPSSGRTGRGIPGMRERAHLAGG